MKYKPIKENIISNVEEISEIAKKKGYIFFSQDKSKVTYKEQNKTYDITSPKEKIRLKIYFNLIEKYKYRIECIEFDVEVNNAGKTDIVVYDDGAKSNAFMVIDCVEKISEVAEGNVLKKAKKLEASYAVCAAKKEMTVVDVKTGKSVRQIPVSYEIGN